MTRYRTASNFLVRKSEFFNKLQIKGKRGKNFFSNTKTNGEK